MGVRFVAMLGNSSHRKPCDTRSTRQEGKGATSKCRSAQGDSGASLPPIPVPAVKHSAAITALHTKVMTTGSFCSIVVFLKLAKRGFVYTVCIDRDMCKEQGGHH